MRKLSGEADPGRRALLTFAVLAPAAVALAACGDEGAPTPGATSIPPEATSAAPASSPAAANTAPARQVPEVAGKDMDLTWLTVVNPQLAAEIRREGERYSGDPSVSDQDDTKYWPRAAVVGVPVEEAGHEPVLNIASVNADPTADDASVVRYADVSYNRGDLLEATVRGKKVEALRARIGETACVLSFVSGEINDQPAGSSWAAESTLPIAQTTVSDKQWQAAPLA